MITTISLINKDINCDVNDVPCHTPQVNYVVLLPIANEYLTHGH